jgi:archaemetzincin
MNQQWTFTTPVKDSVPTKTNKACIGIVPVGKVPEMALKVVAANIQGHFFLPVDILSPIAVPKYAYDKKRLQYNAAIIMKSIESAGFDDYKKIIGVLNADLFVPIFTHVFGEARQGGKVALISPFRLSTNPGAGVTASDVVLERLSKIALHELGHLFNLQHCEDRRCLMHFSGEVTDLDQSNQFFCRYCAAYLWDRITALIHVHS